MHLRPQRLPVDRYRGERTVVYHLCVQDRFHLFADMRIVEAAIGYLEEATHSHGCVVPVYCFMPNHVHLMIKGLADDSCSLSAVSAFKHRTGMWFQRQHLNGRWQRDFYDHVLRMGDDWHHQARYIAMNPVRAGLIEEWSEYPGTGAIGCDLLDSVCGVA